MASLIKFNTLLLVVTFLTTAAATGALAGRSMATLHRNLPVETPRFLPPTGSNSNQLDSLELLDIVLVASVDGKLHALSRSTGRPLWSMTAGSAGLSPAAFAPLVRTTHVAVDPDWDGDEGDGSGQEQYIIEPQSGDIYVLASPGGALQRLAFSMAQFVDMSPFSFSDEEDKRVFVGKKETSLLAIELETGKVKATINSECPWEADVVSSATEIDLDELEDATIPPKSSPTTIFIGRTDYHVSIHSPPSPAGIRPPVQNLSFSVYGPNNQDAIAQASYRRTPDDLYVQSLPTGQVFAVQAPTNPAADEPRPRSAQDQFRWGHAFSEPIVAVFDVVKEKHRQNPFVLLQPSLRLEDVLPHVDFSAALRSHQLPNVDSAYVGLVGQSLFAMSPDRFPLVIFSDTNRLGGKGRHGIPVSGSPASEGSTDVELPDRVDEVTWRRMCRHGKRMDPKCLTGVKRLQSSSSSRLSRLLDAATAPRASQHQQQEQQQQQQSTPPPNPNATQSVYKDRPEPSYSLLPAPHIAGTILTIGARQTGLVTAPLVLLAAFAVALVMWWKNKRMLTSPAPSSSSSSSSLWPPRLTDSYIGNGGTVRVPTPDPKVLPVGNRSVEVPQVTITPASPTSPSYPTQSFALPELPPPEPAPETPPPVTESLPSQSPEKEKEGDENDDSPPEGPATPGKKKVVRRRRGKKKKAGTVGDAGEAEEEEVAAGAVKMNGNGNALGNGSTGKVIAGGVIVQQPQQPVIPSSLVVSEEILGFGSHGTVVYKGSLQGRAVAVKRLLQDFTTLALREVSILQDADDHPNVIRYYYQESQANFLYIALELCPASLADIIERPDMFQEVVASFEPKRALRQITSGLRHLHALKIVHRDIKPPNILISSAPKGGRSGGYRMLISDFGLCRKLETDQTSFLPTMHGAMAAGTVGWRAPEILRGEVSLDTETGDDNASQSSRGSVATVNGSGGSTGKRTRLTKTVDIFALGCLFYYVLTNGGHPYGDRFEREANIWKDNKCLDGLERFGEEGAEAVDLIEAMLDPEPSQRPDTSKCLLHPYFWDSGRRLTFLQDASDRFEIMCRDPRDPMLVALERGAPAVVGYDWAARLDKIFLDNLGKFRKYDGKSIQDLMRALRNKKHHYQDLPDNVKRHVGPMPDGFLAYFTRRFPRLFLHVYGVVNDSLLRHESMFRSYFELQD